MNCKTLLKSIFAAVIVVTGLSTAANAQNLQSVQSYRSTHKKLLAKQEKASERMRLEETKKSTQSFYEESEPEPDIYTEGWESGLVNPYKEANVPNTKKINVRGYCMPVKNPYLTSNYGYRAKFKRTHKGVDIRSAIGDTVRAAFSGRIRLTKYERGGYGFYVIVRHENGLETVYGHLSRFLVKPDQYVKAGQPIALSGNTGRSTGPHLHFETRYMGYAINPCAIFDFANKCTYADVYTFDKSTYTEASKYSRK